MLKQTADHLVRTVPKGLRCFVFFMSAIFASAPVVMLFLPPSPYEFPVPTPIVSIGCVLASLFLLSYTGKNRLELDFVRGRYTVVAGWPFLEKYSQGVIIEDIESLDIEGNLLYVRWKKAKHAKFYMGMHASYNSEALARKMNVPLTTNHPAPIDRSDAILLRASQRVDRDLLQPSDDPQRRSETNGIDALEQETKCPGSKTSSSI